MNDQVILSGQRAVYCKVDISSLWSSSPIDLKKIEQELSSMGFQLLGEIFCSLFSGLFIRGYAQSDGVTYVSIVTKLEENYLVLAGIDFYTRFANGASLTTTRTPNAEDSFEKKIYMTSSTSSNISDICLEHEQRMKILSEEHGETCSAGCSLLAMATTIDEFLVREAA